MKVINKIIVILVVIIIIILIIIFINALKVMNVQKGKANS